MHEEELMAEYMYNQAQSFMKDTFVCVDDLIDILIEHFGDNDNGHLSALALAAARVAGPENSDQFKRLYEKSYNSIFKDDEDEE